MTKELKRRGNEKYQKSVKYIPVPKIDDLDFSKIVMDNRIVLPVIAYNPDMDLVEISRRIYDAYDNGAFNDDAGDLIYEYVSRDEMRAIAEYNHEILPLYKAELGAKLEELGLGKFYRLGERKVAENAVRKYSIYDSKTKTFTDISEDEFNERKNKRYKRSWWFFVT